MFFYCKKKEAALSTSMMAVVDQMVMMPPVTKDGDKKNSPSTTTTTTSASSQQPTTTSLSTTSSASTSSSSSSPVACGWTHLARTVLFDAPLFFILVLYASVVWIHYVHDAYLEPQLHAMRWTPERQEREVTYYARSCTKEDISPTMPTIS